MSTRTNLSGIPHLHDSATPPGSPMGASRPTSALSEVVPVVEIAGER